MKKFFLLFIFGLFAALAMPGLAWGQSQLRARRRPWHGACRLQRYKDYCWLDFTNYVDASGRSDHGCRPLHPVLLLRQRQHWLINRLPPNTGLSSAQLSVTYQVKVNQ